MSFRQRYREALAFKDLDVEEPIDVWFHRPLAAVLTTAIRSSGVTPNQVTFGSLAAGWAGSFWLYHAFLGEQLLGVSLSRALQFGLAAVFLFGSVILDCADGQLARVRGGGSRVGRILDGFVDALVLLPAYVILGFGILHEFGRWAIGVTAVAGVSTWIRTIVYDKTKRIYQAQTVAGGDESIGIETSEDVRADYRRARRRGSLLERFLLRIYLGYLKVQERVASGQTHRGTAERTDGQVAAFRDRYRGTMRLASMLGLGTHMFLIYMSVAAAAIELDVLIWTQVVLATVFNAALVWAVIGGRKMGASGRS